MHRTPLRIAVAVLALSLGLANIAQADDTRTNKQNYIRDAVQDPPSNPFDASDGGDPDGIVAPGSGTTGLTEFSDELHNVQANNPALDNVQTFAGTRPFEFSIQSETSIVRVGNSVVVGYNSSANQPVVRTSAGTLVFVHRYLSGYSYSGDGGKTWTSGFVPPNAGSPFTFGDPSLATDRAGNVYYASLGTTAGGANGAVIVNKSTDSGKTFAPAVVAAIDDGSDKEWLAVGRDPVKRKQDNLYLAWTSFQNEPAAVGGSSQLRLARSFDGGNTWTSKTIFAPVDTGGFMSGFIQFANPVVDPSTGRLYIPFLHFSNVDADEVKVLVSDDAGATFKFLEFNDPNAFDKFGFAVVTPGTLTDCGRNSGGTRLVLRQGTDLGGGRFGLPRYRQATRLITQPSAGAQDGALYLAINSSDSPVFGDPTSTSSIKVLSTKNEGKSWNVQTAVPSTAADPQHVHPAIALNEGGGKLNLVYYVQQSDGKLRVDSMAGQLDEGSLRFEGPHRVSSVAFDLPPTNNPMPITGNNKFTTNYDRTIRPCYAIGEYLSITPGGQENAITAWGDLRNSWTAPTWTPPSSAPGTHSQPDVFVQRLEN